MTRRFDVIIDRHAPFDLAAVAMLAGNVDERGFVTNEHRYLAVAQAARG